MATAAATATATATTAVAELLLFAVVVVAATATAFLEPLACLTVWWASLQARLVFAALYFGSQAFVLDAQ